MLKKDGSAKDGCRAPKPGEVMKNPTLANTFKRLAKDGKKGFYEGPIAEAIIKVTSDLGARLTLEDLKNHGDVGTEEVDAITLHYTGQGVNKDFNGVKLWEHPPNGQGIVALMALGILEEFEKAGKIGKWHEKDHNSVEYVHSLSRLIPRLTLLRRHLHACIEALRISFADSNWWVADPNVSKVPTQELITPSYLAERAKLFSSEKANDEFIDHGSPAHNHSDTVYFAVTDAEGNGCSFINSNYGGFGTGIIPKDCGFTLQNRGANFVLKENHPNVFAPGKRPYHTIIPALITNASDDSLHTVYGVMGGFMQPQGHLQVLLNMLVFGLTPQAALDAPRFCIGAGTPDEGKVLDRTVYLEDGIKPEVVEGLKKLGHEVEVIKGVSRGLFGRGQVIRAHWDDGQIVYSAGSDPRGDGAAMPA
jgi:gamma-glutamyltranspeptidase/glutathione hydrolase